MATGVVVTIDGPEIKLNIPKVNAHMDMTAILYQVLISAVRIHPNSLCHCFVQVFKEKMGSRSWERLPAMSRHEFLDANSNNAVAEAGSDWSII